ncbi:MAG: hypothetical protein JXC32_21340, partial [Anaerolineae bacterium]|nr:hypothetical protein [Anaerolineae bacterium]
MSDNQPRPLPQIPFGDVTLSRLILGANPINGGSHLSCFVNHQMKRYFTPEQVQATLKHCQEEGINTWQSGLGNLKDYRQYVDGGGEIHYIALSHATGDAPTMLEDLVAGGTVGVAHHGEVTDIFWREGQMAKVQEYCKRIRDTGVMVGISTHIPDVVDHVVSEDWDVDFFMCCVYERHRTREQLLERLGHVPLPLKEVYLEDDPPRMYKAMRATGKPCLAFKILAAGRLSDRQEWVEAAFEQAFREIKPNDAVIVGMYPEYEDQVAINAEYTRRFS